MDRDSKRARIQAARDWLGQADDSLGRSDELQGDLKLMLAKAELEGASPGRGTRRLRKWLSRGAALAVAVLMVLAIESWPLGREPAQEKLAPPAEAPAAATETLAEKAGGDGQTPREAAASEGSSLPPREVAEKPAPPLKVQEEPPAREGVFEAGTPQSAATPHLTYAPPQIPSADKQKLMQEAGEVLRR